MPSGPVAVPITREQRDVAAAMLEVPAPHYFEIDEWALLRHIVEVFDQQAPEAEPEDTEPDPVESPAAAARKWPDRERSPIG